MGVPELLVALSEWRVRPDEGDRRGNKEDRAGRRFNLGETHDRTNESLWDPLVRMDPSLVQSFCLGRHAYSCSSAPGTAHLTCVDS